MTFYRRAPQNLKEIQIKIKREGEEKEERKKRSMC
jgi:hypothetical protein